MLNKIVKVVSGALTVVVAVAEMVVTAKKVSEAIRAEKANKKEDDKP